MFAPQCVLRAHLSLTICLKSTRLVALLPFTSLICDEKNLQNFHSPHGTGIQMQNIHTVRISGNQARLLSFSRNFHEYVSHGRAGSGGRVWEGGGVKGIIINTRSWALGDVRSKG